jgi:hypothetical protein
MGICEWEIKCDKCPHGKKSHVSEGWEYYHCDELDMIYAVSADGTPPSTCPLKEIM